MHATVEVREGGEHGTEIWLADGEKTSPVSVRGRLETVLKFRGQEFEGDCGLKALARGLGDSIAGKGR